MKILVTGAAGFIGMHACISLLKLNYEIIGIDNLNNYYDPRLKEDRIKNITVSDSFNFIKCDITDLELIKKICKQNKIDVILHLAAQAGVRYSLNNPYSYIDNNIKGFINILECCRECSIENLIYASSSSVYGGNTELPFKEDQHIDQPLNLYAVTKRANELMSFTYSNLFKIQTVGIRFFTAYGPWGRPDMALSIFANSILNDDPINVYNNGNMIRDFTYIDDIIFGTTKIIQEIDKIFSAKSSDSVPHEVFNLGNGSSETLLSYIKCLEKCLNKKAVMNFLPLQKGEMIETKADISKIKNKINYSSSTPIKNGVEKFCSWYLNYYKKNK